MGICTFYRVVPVNGLNKVSVGGEQLVWKVVDELPQRLFPF
jgi:hypothetical protein